MGFVNDQEIHAAGDIPANVMQNPPNSQRGSPDAIAHVSRVDINTPATEEIIPDSSNRQVVSQQPQIMNGSPSLAQNLSGASSLGMHSSSTSGNSDSNYVSNTPYSIDGSGHDQAVQKAPQMDNVTVNNDMIDGLGHDQAVQKTHKWRML